MDLKRGVRGLAGGVCDAVGEQGLAVTDVFPEIKRQL
jgi:hypothetical protein|tara:strand:- start:1458 stop:1568 length:111 start_codon:yes stop_codon:yes gene_type:complete